MVNIVSDIAGRYDELMLLLDKMPPGEPISIGDMVDRHDQSKQVLDFFMKNGRAIMGNHEHLLLDHCANQKSNKPSYYQYGTWQYNGGSATIRSFPSDVPQEYIDWIRKLPKYLEIDNCLISHAFVHPDYNTVLEACDLGRDWEDFPKSDNSIIWNRSEPIGREYALQICGHNSQFGLRWWGDYAVCLDDSREKKLTGIHLPSRKIYQQDYLK